MRGATCSHSCPASPPRYFNPRAPCGARPPWMVILPSLSVFQSTRPMRGATHALIAILDSNIYFNPRAPCGARPGTMAVKHGKRLFQSTHPSRGATADKVTERLRHEISIHAPHAGRDTRWSSVGSARADFNPRAPCGARRHPQSHPAGSGAISIHAPHAGRDDFSNASQVGGALFQSTRPVRARRAVRIQPVSAA